MGRQTSQQEACIAWVFGCYPCTIHGSRQNLSPGDELVWWRWRFRCWSSGQWNGSSAATIYYFISCTPLILRCGWKVPWTVPVHAALKPRFKGRNNRIATETLMAHPFAFGLKPPPTGICEPTVLTASRQTSHVIWNYSRKKVSSPILEDLPVGENQYSARNPKRSRLWRCLITIGIDF